MDLIDRFGTDAVIDFTDTENPKLVIAINNFLNSPNGDLTTGGFEDLVGLTSLTVNEYADKIFAAIFLLGAQNQPTENTNPLEGSYVSPSYTRRFVRRGNENQIEFVFTVSFYKADTVTFLDPDDVL